MIVDNQRYTLDEARVIIKKQHCTTYGHDYSVVAKRLMNSPVRVVCDNCGEKWDVVSPDNDQTQLIPRVDAPTQVLSRPYH